MCAKPVNKEFLIAPLQWGYERCIAIMAAGWKQMLAFLFLVRAEVLPRIPIGQLLDRV